MNLEELIFPTLEVFHILGIVLLVGTTAMVDFAVLGFGLKSPGPAEIAQQLRVWSWTGLGLILLSGPMMFLTDPDMYYLNHAFQAKMVLLLAAVVVISLRAVGTIMAVTMLVTPAATARLFSRTIRQMTTWAVALGVVEGVTGLMLAYHLSSSPGATIGLLAAVTFAVMFAVTLPRRMPHHHRPIG